MKRNIYILYALALLQGMVFYAPVATLYRQAAGIGIFQISLIESICLALMILLELPWGWAADRIGYRRTMILCCGLYFLSKLVFWRADSFGDFLLERVILSVVCAGLSGVDTAMLYLSCPAGESHQVFSLYSTLGEAGVVLSAGVFALFLGDNYRLAALLTAVSYGLAACLTLGLREVKSAEQAGRANLRQAAQALRQQLCRRENLLLLIAAALLAPTHSMVTTFLSQPQYTRAGMSVSAISWAYIGVSLTGLLGGLSAGLCARLGEGPTGRGLIALAGLACAALALTDSPAISVAAVLVLQAAFSLFAPLETELENRLVRSEDRATALSVNAMVVDSLAVVLDPAFGSAAEESLPLAMALGAALCAAAFLCFHLCLPKTAPQKPQ